MPKRHKKFSERLNYFYIKNIKKWMFCPACKEGKMIINKKSNLWICEDCDYKLSNNEFKNEYVFWFCDECETYLNTQDEFNINSNKHICRKCGYENDISENNIKGCCSDCGKLLSDPDATICIDCKKIRRKKAKEWLIATGIVVAGVALSAMSSENNIKSVKLSTENDNFDYVNKIWLQQASEEELRYVSDNIQSKLQTLDYESDEYLKLSNLSVNVVNTIASRFPLNIRSREHGRYLPNDD